MGLTGRQDRPDEQPLAELTLSHPGPVPNTLASVFLAKSEPATYCKHFRKPGAVELRTYAQATTI